jgi:PhnB protein
VHVGGENTGGIMTFVPYLSFDGKCAEAFRFYATLLNGQLEMQTHGESPIADQVPAEQKDHVTHARLVVDGAELMGSDAPPEQFHKMQGLYVSIGVNGVEEGRRIFEALAEGGTVALPYESTFWSPGFGMVTDRFGTPWMVNVTPKQ